MQLVWKDLNKGYDLRNSLKAFKGPVLIAQGRQDPIGEAIPFQIKESLPQAQMVFIEKSGHYPWLEQEEKFYQILHSFLSLK